MRRLTCLALAMGVGLAVVSGCGGGGSAGSPSTPTPTTPPQAAAHNLLFISDSVGWNVASLYAKSAEQALGGTVKVYDWATGSQSAAAALARLKASSAIVASADIIVVLGGGSDAGQAASLFQQTCMTADATARQPPPLYTTADWQPYRDQLDAMYAEIWKQRAGKPTVLRALDYYNPVIAQWRLAGIESQCSAGLASMSAALREVAATNGATMVSLYDLFNGASHQDDPVLRGYIAADGVHTTPTGASAIAAALASAGFSTVTR